MPTDIANPTEKSPLLNLVRSTYLYGRLKGRIPGFDWTERYAHWALRIPLAGLLMFYGLQKFPSVFVAPGDYGVPAVLYVLAAFAEVFGAVALIIGGIFETWRPKLSKLRLFGDALTRAGGAAGVAAVLGVILYFYWGALTIADLQVMALGLSAFLLMRGNKYGQTSAVHALAGVPARQMRR
jgi:hypothetical protein